MIDQFLGSQKSCSHFVFHLQNIDTLEHVAGLSPDKIVEAHGTFHTSHCVTCGASYTQEWIKGWYFVELYTSEKNGKLFSLEAGMGGGGGRDEIYHYSTMMSPLLLYLLNLYIQGLEM